MAKDDIDIREHKELNIALSNVDKIVMRKYISTIDKRPVFVPSFDVTFAVYQEKSNGDPSTDLPVCVVGTNIMLGC